jgi:hypothetical protein
MFIAYLLHIYKCVMRVCCGRSTYRHTCGVCVYVHTCMHSRLFRVLYSRLFRVTFTCSDTYFYRVTCTHVPRRGIHTYILTYVYTCIHIYVHTYILTYMYTYIHIYVHTYIHVYPIMYRQVEFMCGM